MTLGSLLPSNLRLRFLTATPQNVTAGSGTYVGIHVLAQALRDLGHTVDFETPTRHFPIFTLERLWFNHGLRRSPQHDVTIGFDCDGYTVASRAPHVASLKGVIADEVRFERGFTRFTMGVQASRERLHVHRAARVMVTSRYCEAQVRKLYGFDGSTAIVPELIDLAAWRTHLAAAPPYAQTGRRTILFVGRFYRRKRVDMLLRAAAQLRDRIELRIVGNGPCNAMWRDLGRSLQLDGTVTWLGDVTRTQLAAEYNRCDGFCLPSVQEGFGIVLLEAMAARKPIVAARAAAIPEVAPHATLVEPDNPDALAAALSGALPRPAPADWLEQFDAPRVAQLFLGAVTPVISRSA
jgi:glycosyltransferase involved in cell wall biosynthesis